MEGYRASRSDIFTGRISTHSPRKPSFGNGGDTKASLPRRVRDNAATVFTGITGGHDIKWYYHKVDSNDSDSAWGHLLDPNFKTNAYLNKLTRRAYCSVFERAGFKILRDDQLWGRIGEKHLTEKKRKALSAYDDYELFSNEIEFWLAPV